MSNFKFPSLAAPDKRAYVYVNHPSFDIAHPPVDEHFQFFETYGDGMTQHSVAVTIGAPLLADYLFSLCAAIIDSPEASDRLYLTRFTEDYTADIEFASTIKYKAPKEGSYYKPRYYSMQEKKVSAAERLRHDKRYEEVLSWMNGEAESICQLLYQDHYAPFQMFMIRHAVRDWAFKHDLWMEMPTLEKDADHSQTMEWQNALEAIQSTVRSLNGLAWVRRVLKNKIPKQEEVA